MTISTSPRLALTRWSADGDIQNRSQFDSDNAQLDTLVAIDVQDLLSNRPAPGIRGRFFTESSGSGGLPGTTWREDGAGWRAVGSRVVAASSGDVGRVVRGAVAQSSDLDQWQNSAGSVLSRIDSSGALFAPAATIAGSPVLTAASSLAWSKLTGAPSLVNTVAGRSGAVSLSTGDIAGLSSASVGFASSAGAVDWANVTSKPSIVNTVGGRSGAVSLSVGDIAGAMASGYVTALQATVTTDANGFAWVNHGHSGTPVAVFFQMWQGSNYIVNYQFPNINGTQIYTRTLHADSNTPVVSNTYTVWVIAVG